MLSLIEELSQYNVIIIILIIVATALLFKEGYTTFIWFKDMATKNVKSELSKEDLTKIIFETQDSLKEIVKQQGEIMSQQDEDRKQSIMHDERLAKSMEELKEGIKIMSEKQRESKRAELKDRISQSYRYYNKRKLSKDSPIPYWKEMEKDALNDLIKDYENNGGLNSFVHTKVQAESLTWEVVPNDYKDDVNY